MAQTPLDPVTHHRTPHLATHNQGGPCRLQIGTHRHVHDE